MIDIRTADIASPGFVNLVSAHKAEMLRWSPPESSHALTADEFEDPSISVWTVFENDDLVGCFALKEIDPRHGEIKAMHILKSFRGQGYGRVMLKAVMSEADNRNYQRVSLETGSQMEFSTAKKLYEGYGFEICEPFATYQSDPNSIFMTISLYSSIPPHLPEMI